MRKSIFLLTASFLTIATNSLNKSVNNSFFSLKNKDSIIQKGIYSHAVISIEGYCFNEIKIIALIVSEEQQIVLNSFNAKSKEKAFIYLMELCTLIIMMESIIISILT